MKNRASTNRPANGGNPQDKPDPVNPVFLTLPIKHYADLQSAIAQKRFAIGVDPLAAAQWSSQLNSGLNKVVITTLSVLLVVAAVASIVVAIAVQNYWLLLALPIQALAFYGAHLDQPYRLWVTTAGVVSLIVFLNLLLNNLPTAATLVAYAGLTFSAVRATSSITNSAFRKALLVDEQLFVEAYANRACTLRDTNTKEVYEYDVE
jgi:hypothetical protein